MRCPNCGLDITPINYNYCPWCGMCLKVDAINVNSPKVGEEPVFTPDDMVDKEG